MPNATPQTAIVHRVARCLRIWQLLRQTAITRAELAAQFGVSERRIQDDLLILKAAGVDVQRVHNTYVVREDDGHDEAGQTST
jgi:predicted DNA-binding transcriptional regulator YafY